jgi:uncharacterized membrane protein
VVFHHQPDTSLWVTTRLFCGADSDKLVVCVFGFFLIWKVPHKQKIGILTGITFQLALNVFAAPEETEEDYDMED